MPKFKVRFLQLAAIATIVLGSGFYGLSILSEEGDLPAGPHAASACTENWSNLPSDIKPQYLQPTKIVVQPWKGRHHVYAEFNLPSQGYLVNDRFRVDIDKLGGFCGVVSSFPSPDGKGLAIARLRTRTALWLISQGKFSALNQPQNWELEILPTNSNSLSARP